MYVCMYVQDLMESMFCLEHWGELEYATNWFIQLWVVSSLGLNSTILPFR